jgi:hypothetical protein
LVHNSSSPGGVHWAIPGRRRLHRSDADHGARNVPEIESWTLNSFIVWPSNVGGSVSPASTATKIRRFDFNATLATGGVPRHAILKAVRGAQSVRVRDVSAGTGGKPGSVTYVSDLRPNLWLRFIFNSMDRTATTPACVIAWLLCAVLVCLVVHPPQCDQCDGPLAGISSQQTIANQQQPATPGSCNGICWCCGFHGLPNAGPDLSTTDTVTTNVWPVLLSPVCAPRSSIYRPPRTDASS